MEIKISQEKMNEIIHEFTKVGQMFHSFDALLTSPQINIDRKRVILICRKCARRCIEVRQFLLENLTNGGGETNVKDSEMDISERSDNSGVSADSDKGGKGNPDGGSQPVEPIPLAGEG